LSKILIANRKGHKTQQTGAVSLNKLVDVIEF
jgi:hypothetical protein